MIRRQQEEEMRRRQGGGGRHDDRFGNQNDFRGGGGGNRGNDMGQNRGDMRDGNSQPMAPPPAPPAGLNLDRRNMQNQGHMGNNMGDIDMRHGNHGNMGG